MYLSESALICWHFVTDELVGVGLFQLKWRFSHTTGDGNGKDKASGELS